MEKEKKFDLNQKYKNFENAIKRLEEIVSKLESEEVSLEEALSLFEEGMDLVNYCDRKLEEVKHKVEIVIRTKTGHTVEPFNEERLNEIRNKLSEKKSEEDEIDDDLPF